MGQQKHRFVQQIHASYTHVYYVQACTLQVQSSPQAGRLREPADLPCMVSYELYCTVWPPSPAPEANLGVYPRYRSLPTPPSPLPPPTHTHTRLTSRRWMGEIAVWKERITRIMRDTRNIHSWLTIKRIALRNSSHKSLNVETRAIHVSGRLLSHARTG